MPTTPSSFFTDPTMVFGYLAGLLATVFWLSTLPRLKRFFSILPPVIWAYFLPTLSTAAGITPLASPAYDWISRFLLPLALFLLMITVDLRAIARLGRMALVMMLAGTLGIVLGAPVALLTFSAWLPPDAWKGLAALSGSWIGGTANMLAIARSVGTPDGILGPVLVVDTVVGYGWMGILLFLSAWQTRFDTWNRADRSVLADMDRHLSALDAARRPLEIRDILLILGLGFGATALAVHLGGLLPPLGDPTIISRTTWTVLIVVTGGLILSFTPVRALEPAGASRLGYAALYLLIASIGAQADLLAVLATPAFFAAGVVWIAVHATVLLVVARLMRAPLFFVATGSVANIGGAASAPVVAGIYHPALAPVGLLMGVSGYILGIYAALGCAWILGQLAG